MSIPISHTHRSILEIAICITAAITAVVLIILSSQRFCGQRGSIGYIVSLTLGSTLATIVCANIIRRYLQMKVQKQTINDKTQEGRIESPTLSSPKKPTTPKARVCSTSVSISPSASPKVAVKKFDLSSFQVQLKQNLDECVRWIHTLDLPCDDDRFKEEREVGREEKIGKDGKWKERIIDSHAIETFRLKTYTKESLTKDFTLAYQHALKKLENVTTQEEAIEIAEELPKLEKALKLHLELEISSETFSRKGIPNNQGTNCFFNTSLQLAVHNPFFDYPLLRPLLPPTLSVKNEYEKMKQRKEEEIARKALEIQNKSTEWDSVHENYQQKQQQQQEEIQKLQQRERELSTKKRTLSKELQWLIRNSKTEEDETRWHVLEEEELPGIIREITHLETTRKKQETLLQEMTQDYESKIKPISTARQQLEDEKQKLEEKLVQESQPYLDQLEIEAVDKKRRLFKKVIQGLRKGVSPLDSEMTELGAKGNLGHLFTLCTELRVPQSAQREVRGIGGPLLDTVLRTFPWQAIGMGSGGHLFTIVRSNNEFYIIDDHKVHESPIARSLEELISYLRENARLSPEIIVPCGTNF